MLVGFVVNVNLFVDAVANLGKLDLFVWKSTNIHDVVVASAQARTFIVYDAVLKGIDV
jgi:hypothetical protein